MADVLNFAITLEDHVSANAHKSARALQDLSNELKAGKTKLAAYQQQLAKAKQLGDIEGYRKYSKLVDESRRSVFDMTQSLEGMGKAASGGGAELGALAGPIGIVAAAAAAAGAAFVAMAVDITKEAVKMAFEVGEVNEKLTATFDALGVGGPNAGKKTLAMLDDLSRKLPQGRDQLAQWVKQYEAMGMTDLGEIRRQVLATASAQAIMGDEGAAAYETLTKKVQEAVEAHHGLKLAERTLTQLYNAGLNLDDVAKRMGLSTKDLTSKLKAGTLDAAKFGAAMQASLTTKGKGPLEAMGNSLDTLKKKGMEALGHLFDGIDLSPVTDALKGFISLLDQGKPSGEVMKKGVSGAIQGIVKWMGKMLVEGQVLFLSLEVWALKHKGTLKLIEKAFGLIGEAILKVTAYVSDLFAKGPPKWLEVLGRISLAGITGGGSEVAFGGAKIASALAPAHASGGLVGRPAPGEFFASVAPGEFILPKRQTREMLGGGLGSLGRAMFTPPANANAGGGGNHFGHVALHINAPHGVTDAAHISASALSVLFERYQLASGR